MFPEIRISFRMSLSYSVHGTGHDSTPDRAVHYRLDSRGPHALDSTGHCELPRLPLLTLANTVAQGIALVGAGIILNFQSIQTYVIDAFTLHAASALAAVTFLRSCAGFGFPLFAPTMYKVLGYGKGDTILACVAIVVGCPAYVPSVVSESDRNVLTRALFHQTLGVLEVRRTNPQGEQICSFVRPHALAFPSASVAFLELCQS